jgi:predicted nucleic acid-binding protein
MVDEPVLLDSDTLSELSRGNAAARERALTYLSNFGRLTITAVTVFERLRGYRLALEQGKSFEKQLQAFELLVKSCIVLPFDEAAATVAAELWSRISRKQQQALGDILIASIAVSRGLPLVTRNRRDFEAIARAAGIELRLADWCRVARESPR